MLRDGTSATGRVLAVLKESGGGLSVKGLCEKLDLSSMAVRRQLFILEGQGLVQSKLEKNRTGRPSNAYYLTDKGHEQFQREYSDLAVELLLSTRKLCGKVQINAILAHRNQELLKEARGKVLGRTLEARVHEVAQLLSQGGYMATWEKLGPGRYLIKEMNCAVALVARRFPQICIFEESFLAELLQAKVSRRHHILQKDHFCSYLVEGS